MAFTRAVSSRNAEGLGQVVVSAHLQSEHAVELRRLGREHQNRRVGLGLTQPPADLQAVEPGQHQIENHQVQLACLGFRLGSL